MDAADENFLAVDLQDVADQKFFYDHFRVFHVGFIVTRTGLYPDLAVTQWKLGLASPAVELARDMTYDAIGSAEFLGWLAEIPGR